MIRQQSYPFGLLLLLAFRTVSNNDNVAVNAYDWTCNLFCYNKGVCRHGHGKFGAFNGMDANTDELPFEKELHDDGMYCTCPEGFTGLQCEIKYVTCGRDDHTCFNGSACVLERSSQNGNVFYRCECDVKGSVMDAPYAGKYCEHIATTFCATGSGLEHGSSFCTNGGKCKPLDPDSTKKHVGCDCPVGWEGAHCEEREAVNIVNLSEQIAHEFEDVLNAGEIVAIMIGVVVGLVLLLYVTKMCLGRRKRGRGFDRRGLKTQELGLYSDNGTADVI